MNYLLLPGNPPAVHFYEEWCREIMARQPGSVAKASIYPTLPRMTDSTQAMSEVLQAHLQCLHDFHDETGKPVTLVGHSLGGYFAMKLLERAPDQVQMAILVHPFLRSPDLRGKLILTSVSLLHTSASLQKLVLRMRSQLERLSSDLSYVTHDELLKAFHLGWHERRTISRDRSPIKIDPSLRDKIHLLYTRDDSWFRAEQVAQMRDQVPSQECLEPHGFVTEKKHRESLFERIAIIPPAGEPRVPQSGSMRPSDRC